MSTPSLTTHEYKIVASFSPLRLEEAVQQLMSSGWQLTGGVSHFGGLAEPWTQTMYRIQTIVPSLLKS